MNDLKRLAMWAASIAFAVIAIRALASGSSPAEPASNSGAESNPSAPAWSVNPTSGPTTGSESDAGRGPGPEALRGGDFDIGLVSLPFDIASSSGVRSSSTGVDARGNRPGRPRTAELAIEDAELVLGPHIAGFDTAAVIALHGGALAGHFESMNGANSSSAEVIDSVAMDHSVSPALILTILELASSTLTGNSSLASPLGDTAAAMRGESLHTAAGRIAAWLNDAYYAERHRGGRLLSAQSVRTTRSSGQPNAAQAGVAHALGSLWPEGSEEQLMASFADTYGRLFGDLSAEPSSPPIPDGLEQPPLLLPWPEGEAWHLTGGPHGSWGVGTAWGAIDFAPPSPVGCSAAPEWVIASAPGVVMSSREGQVLVDLDGDGLVQTGWVVLYQHMSTGERVPVGTRLNAGELIGHPSCEGGFSTGSHVHFARRYDGEWLPAADGPVPLVLSGWKFTSGPSEYDGEMSHENAGERVALKRRNGRITSVVSDNGEAGRAAHAAAWAALDRSGSSAVAAAVEFTGAMPAPDAVAATPGLTGAMPTSDIVAFASTETTAAQVPIAAASAGAAVVDSEIGAGSFAPKLIVRLLLQGRRQHDTAFIVALERLGEPPIGLFGHTDESGTSTPIAMPYSVGGHYDVVLRAPGFAPARVIAAPIEQGVVEIDFSGGGLTPLRAGDLNGDAAVNASDVLAWFNARGRGRGSADLNGDGKAGFGDFLRMVLPALRNG